MFTMSELSEYTPVPVAVAPTEANTRTGIGVMSDATGSVALVLMKIA